MKTFDLDGRIAGWRGPVLAALLTLIAGLPGPVSYTHLTLPTNVVGCSERGWAGE